MKSEKLTNAVSTAVDGMDAEVCRNHDDQLVVYFDGDVCSLCNYEEGATRTDAVLQRLWELLRPDNPEMRRARREVAFGIVEQENNERGACEATEAELVMMEEDAALAKQRSPKPPSKEDLAGVVNSIREILRDVPDPSDE